ncbi:MAG TPA: protein kinase, partial [Rhodothermales bacterium]|nr:protein kinase [Rhodothermales bacterium]
MSKTERTQINLNFQILETLGKGGMGEIYKARDTRLNRIVAVKVLLANQFANEEAHLRFKREAQAGAQLEHDNIVTTYDFGIHDGRPFLVMGFIEGETLHQRLKREGMLSVETTIRMIAPIARALAYAHGKSVIHRDITSNNIMIRAEDERPMLIDFGIAQAAYDHRLTAPGESLGTITYMSPEQAKGQEVDYRSDLYSLGVVLYECLTGTLPFQSSNSLVLLSNIRFEPHPPLLERRPDLPPWIAKVVDRCLAKDPVDRFQNGNALADALEQSRPLGKKRSTAPPAAVPPPLPQSPPAIPENALQDQVQPVPEPKEEASDIIPPTPVPEPEKATSKIPSASPASDRDPLPAPERVQNGEGTRRLWMIGLLVTTIAVLSGGAYGYQAGLFNSLMPASSLSDATETFTSSDPPPLDSDDPFAYGDSISQLPMAVLSDSLIADLPDDVPEDPESTTTAQSELPEVEPAEDVPAEEIATEEDLLRQETPDKDTPASEDQKIVPPEHQIPTPADMAAQGVAAYRAKKYNEARPLLRTAAREGVAEAQFL